METKDRKSIEKEMRHILISILGVEEYEITPDIKIQDHLGADSMEVLDIVIEAEKVFKIKIPDEKIFQITTFGKLCDLIQNILAGN